MDSLCSAVQWIGNYGRRYRAVRDAASSCTYPLSTDVIGRKLVRSWAMRIFLLRLQFMRRRRTFMQESIRRIDLRWDSPSPTLKFNGRLLTRWPWSHRRTRRKSMSYMRNTKETYITISSIPLLVLKDSWSIHLCQWVIPMLCLYHRLLNTVSS